MLASQDLCLGLGTVQDLVCRVSKRWLLLTLGMCVVGLELN